jgi:hypothetical protein
MTTANICGHGEHKIKLARFTDWTRSETLAAIHIYLKLPFGQLHRNQPRIVQLSKWIGRTAYFAETGLKIADNQKQHQRAAKIPTHDQPT